MDVHCSDAFFGYYSVIIELKPTVCIVMFGLEPMLWYWCEVDSYDYDKMESCMGGLLDTLLNQS